MPSSFKYFNIIRLKHVSRNGLNPLSTLGYYYSSRSKFGLIKCKLNFTRNLSSYICRINFIPFEDLIEKRRSQAKRSVIVEIHKEDCIASLESLCYEFGNVKSITEFKSTPKRMILVEFEEESSTKEIFSKVLSNSNGDDMKFQSPFLKLNNGFKLPKFDPLDIDKRNTTHLDTSGPNLPPKISNMLDAMNSQCSNVSEQIQYYYDSQKMSELSWRLRFLTCRKIEWALPSVVSHWRVIPFGSSVNTFGHNNSDLDMNLDFSSSFSNKNKNFPFNFQENEMSGEKSLQIIAELLFNCMPGFDKIVKIFSASVPIVKCRETFTGLECDITAHNPSGYFMSEILYLYGCSDPRVRPLVFSIRLWAKEKRLTRKEEPWAWFSNFTMTMLVLYFLMNTNSAAVIPPFSVLVKLSESSLICNGMHYLHLSDIKTLPESSNNQSLEELLLDFFKFYAVFNYKNGISINTGKTSSKNKHSALHIENPLELHLNVARSVRYEHLECFKEECIKASFLLEDKKFNNSSSSNSWGLSALLENNNINVPKRITMPLNLKQVFNQELSENQNLNQLQGKSRVQSDSKKNIKRSSNKATVDPFSNKNNNSKKSKPKFGKPYYQF